METFIKVVLLMLMVGVVMYSVTVPASYHPKVKPSQHKLIKSISKADNNIHGVVVRIQRI